MQHGLRDGSSVILRENEVVADQLSQRRYLIKVIGVMYFYIYLTLLVTIFVAYTIKTGQRNILDLRTKEDWQWFRSYQYKPDLAKIIRTGLIVWLSLMTLIILRFYSL